MEQEQEKADPVLVVVELVDMDQEISQNIAELRAYIERGIEYPEGFDVRHAVAMLKQCKCVTPGDGPVFMSCVVAILSVL